MADRDNENEKNGKISEIKKPEKASAQAIRDQRLISLNPDCPEPILLERAAEVIKNGGTVVFPTETVYGLGANGLDPEACLKIYEAKGRPADNPLILHIAQPEHIVRLGKDISDNVKRMAKTFWPGPLTMVVKRQDKVPDVVTAGLDTVAVRCPRDPIAHALIAHAGVPIAAPSANLSGSPSPTKAAHVLEDMAGRVDLIITSRDADIGVESTVVDITGDVPVILRPGRITREEIAKVCGDCKISPAILAHQEPEHPASPGMKYTHYSPEAQVLLTEQDGAEDRIRQEMAAHPDLHYALIAPGDKPSGLPEDVDFLSLGEKPEDYEHQLFATLRKTDEDHIDRALVILPEAGEKTLAVRDRLMHAAGYQYLEGGSV